MKYSPEALTAFALAAELGSFSAAARKLRKSQSTISVAIANLEADIGCSLFDRDGRQPRLNAAGRQVLGVVNTILNANQQLNALSVRLVDNVESLVSMVASDLFLPLLNRELLSRFAERFPDTEFRCGPSEHGDVIVMIQEDFAQLGLTASQPHYPADIAHQRLSSQAAFNLYVSHSHPLAALPGCSNLELSAERQLRLKTYAPEPDTSTGNVWSAPDYLTLLEFTRMGLGWAELPDSLVERFGQELTRLNVRGYPRTVALDVIWSRNNAPGVAGQWLVDQITRN